MQVLTDHQKKQIEVIEKLEEQIKRGDLGVSTFSPARDFERDNRICLTGVHFPKKEFVEKIENELIKPLKQIDPNQYYYPHESIHVTIKNIRVINDPPNFDENVIEKAKGVFEKVCRDIRKFNVYFYKLILFPNNLSLVGTTDLEFDKLVLSLDKKLKDAGIPDDKTGLIGKMRWYF